MTATLLLAHQLLWTLLLASTAWAAGTLCVGHWRSGAAAALRIALGLLLLGQALQVLGLVRALRPVPIAVLFGAVHVAAATAWLRRLRQWRASSWPASGAAAATAPDLTRAVAVHFAIVALALILWVLALYPPVAFDETLYHLPFTRAFADSGGLPFLPDLRFPVFPQLAEILAVPIFMVSGDVATHLISWLATLATAGVLVAWGEALGQRAAGRLAAALWLGTPIVGYLSGVGYIEPLLAMGVTGALYAFDRCRRADSTGWLIVAGIFAGSAASIKYHGLIVVGGLLVATLIRRSPLRGRLREAAVFGASALLASAMAYGRILADTGNPLFPFYSRVFGSSAWSSLESQVNLGEHGWAAFVTLPWRLVFERASTGAFPPHSPALLIALPAAFYGAWRWPSLRASMAIAIAYTCVFSGDSRYLVVVLPLVAIAAGAAVATWIGDRRRAGALAVLLLLPGIGYAAYSAVRRGPPPLNAAAREAYLERWLPLYPAVSFLNRREHGRYTAYAIHGEEMVYWAQGRWLGDWGGPLAYARVLPLLDRPAAFHRKLRAVGVEYLVVPRGRSAGAAAAVAASPFFARVYSTTAADVYAVLDLAAPAPASSAQ